MIEIIEKIIVFFHVFLIFIITIGPFLPGKYLIYYLFLWPAIYFHWHFNDNKCMLTEIEYNINKKFFNNIVVYDYYNKIYLFSILRKLNINFSNFDSFDNFFLLFSSILWIIAFIRALIYYRKDFSKDWNSVRNHFISRFIYDSCKS